MKKIPKISLIFCLAGFIAVGSGSVFASDIQKEFSTVETELASETAGDTYLHSTPFSALLLSEIDIKSGSEIEPKVSDSESYLSASDLRFNDSEYIKKIRRATISLRIRDLIFPFHTHF